jgi:ABC-2 type transport system ATP-binding protein
MTETPDSPPPPLVEVDDLKVEFGETTALRGISFAVQRGEIFGLIGPNGAGKTTTLRVLATLLEPTAGRVTIDGTSVVEDPERVRPSIGYMPDACGVYEGNTVAEYLEFFAGAYKTPVRERAGIVRDVLTLTDLDRLKDRLVGELSRGMKQRLCLARTLVHDPSLLILDEPASALDPRARVEMRELLKELSRMGKAVVISSHILTELADLCDSVAILERGRVVATGRIDDIQARSRRGRVKVRLAVDHEAAAEVLVGAPDVTEVTAQGADLFFEYGGEPRDFHRVVKVLVDAGVPVLTIEQEADGLERLFLELTEGDVQ